MNRSSFTRRTARRLGLALPAAALAAALTLTGCAGSAEPVPTAGGTLTYGRLAPVDNLDLHTQITANNAFAIDKIFEPLVSFTESGEIVEWIAESHEISEDGKTYTFTLRDGVQFSDGTDVTPADVVFSLKRHIEVPGPLAFTAPVADVVAKGDNQVVITLDTPYTPFLSELANFAAGIAPADFGGKTEEEFFKAPVGTGPFVVSEWDPAGDLTFVKNEHYWQDGKPAIDSLVYKFIADDNQQLQQLTAGQLDAIEQVPAANAESVKSNAATALSQSDSWAIEQIFFNTKKPEFADRNVRRAIAQTLDLEGIAKATTFGTSHAATSLIPPTIEYSAADPGVALAYDVDAAKADLAASAYPEGFTAKLLIPSGNAQRSQIAQIVQESAAKIGITIEIDQVDIATFRERFKAFDYDMMINSGQSDAPDPNGLVTFQADPEGFSQSFWTSYTNDDVTKLMHEGRTTAEGPERQKIYEEIQQILADDAPYIPLYFASNLKGTTSKVNDFVVLPNGSVRFQDAWLSE